MYVREVTVRYRRRHVDGEPPANRRVQRPADAAAILVPLLGDEVVEVCGVLCLSVRGDLLAYHELSRGTLNGTLVHPRELFRTALLTQAAAVVIAHNHPSGDPSPSPDDVVLTDRVKAAADLIGIELLDHIIVGADRRYYSFRDPSTTTAT